MTFTCARSILFNELSVFALGNTELLIFDLDVPLIVLARDHALGRPIVVGRLGVHV